MSQGRGGVCGPGLSSRVHPLVSVLSCPMAAQSRTQCSLCSQRIGFQPWLLAQLHPDLRRIT